MSGHPCSRMTGVSGVEPHVVEGVGPAPTRDTSLPGMGGDWRHCAGLDLRYFEADGDGWFMPRMVFQLLNRQESLKDGIALPKQKPSGILRAMAFDQVCPERLLDAPFDWEEP